MLSVRNLEKIYASPRKFTPALKGVSFDIEPGKIFGLIGKPGAGKTTLGRTVLFFDRPSSGEVFLEGQSLTCLPNKNINEIRKQIGLVPQGDYLLASRTVYDNLSLPLEIQGQPKLERSHRIDRILDTVGIAPLAPLYPAQLSFLQKQAVALARSLVLQPKIIIWDHLSLAGDPKAARALLKMVQQIQQAFQMTFLLMGQEFEPLKLLCDQIAVLHLGQLIEQGEVQQLLLNPKTEITQEFIHQMYRKETPNHLKRRLRTVRVEENDCPILRIVFPGKTAQETELIQALQPLGLSINIIQAHQESFTQWTASILLVEIKGSAQNIERALHFWKRKGFYAEVLGYVSSND